METLAQLRGLLASGHNREALQLVNEILRSENPEQFECMAAALWDRAESSHDASDSTREALYRAAIRLQQQARGEFSEGVWTAWWHLAAFLDRRGDLEGADLAYRSMIAVAEGLVNSEPALRERALARYADLLTQRGELRRAQELLHQVIASLGKAWPGREQRESRFGKKGPSLLEVLGDLRLNLLQQGKLDEAETVAARMAEIRATDHTHTSCAPKS